MINSKIAIELEKNKKVFEALLSNIPDVDYSWKPAPDKWCLLEIVCHLYDEEREDFRARAKHTLFTPSEPLPSINPTRWVEEKKYMNQNYNDVLRKFLDEREQSVVWLNSLSNQNWTNAYIHPKFGAMTAHMFLVNWVAHDYLHIRQILKIKYELAKKNYNEELKYAGDW